MNRAALLFFLLLFAVNVSLAQKQNKRLIGLITYQNTGDPVSGVAITPTGGANPTNSNDLGQFTLDFPGKSPGDVVKLILSKEQYMVIGLDPMIVEVAIRQDAGDVVRIVMSKKEEYTRREEKYVKAIEQQLLDKDKEVQFYRSQLKENELTDAERRGLTRQIGELMEEIEQLEKNKEELAKRLAQVDLDQASSFAREALMEFETGSLEKALALMEDKKLDDFWENVLEQEEKVKRAKKQGVENYMIKARLLSAAGQFEGAYENFIKAVERDSTNVENLWELAYFCGALHQQRRAIRFYRQALKYSTLEANKAVLLNNLGNEYQNNSQFPQAEAAYLQALEIRKRLAQDNPQLYEQHVATTQNNMGAMYSALNVYDKAEAAYLQALEIRKKIYLNSDNVKTRKELSNLYGSMAYFYLFRKQFDVAAEYAEKGLQTDDTQEWMINNLALAYLYMGNFEEAKRIFSDIKDKPHPWSPRYETYKDATIECLDELEAAGITHPDVEKIRELLKN